MGYYSPHIMLGAGPQQTGIQANRKQGIAFVFITALYHYSPLVNPFSTLPAIVTIKKLKHSIVRDWRLGKL